jgi:uncharacterized protein (DUF1501 family)
MKRRDFFRKTVPAATMIPVTMGGFSLQAFSETSPMVRALMNTQTETDHVLVLVQLVGGNDGLNMVIPLDVEDLKVEADWGTYQNARANIAIPKASVLRLNGVTRAGLHPAMTGLQTLYNENKLSIIQAVGYPTPSFSHFRATDIWMTGSDSNVELNSGWTGRYLNGEYPNFPQGFPNTTAPHPLAIQIGSVTSLALQGPAVSMGMSISDPNAFYDFLDNVGDPTPATPWGKELDFVRLVARQSESYSTVVKAAAAKVSTQATYPANNDLAAQLKIVARLIAGGLKTRVYMVSTGSFDNHSAQAVTSDTTTGTHATLLKRVSDGIKAFMDDIKQLGVENRVVGMTFSEFGRRIKSNANVGTDHGAASPLFVFGSQVNSAMLGRNPFIASSPTVNDSVPMQYDFRSIYASLMSDWFCVTDNDLLAVMNNKVFQELPLIANARCQAILGVTGLEDLNRAAGTQLIINYPNPFTDSTRITFKSKGGHTMIQVMDTEGRVIKMLADRDYTPGTYNIDFNSGNLPTGAYYLRLQNGPLQQVRPMLKVR